MYIKLSKYFFYRKKNNLIYLFNQLNYAERYYELDAMDFFEVLSKEAQTIDTIINELLKTFDVGKNELLRDYLEFIEDLAKDGFVITGNSIAEIEEKEPKFTYKNFAKSSPSNQSTENIKDNEHISSISDIKAKDELFVENLYLEVTRRCNEKCKHCYIPQNQRSKGDFISLEDAKNFIDQAKELGIWELTITGGEPFLHPKIIEILRYARERGVIIAILSNLTVLKDKHIEVLKEIYPSHIQVSLYSLNPDVHDAITCLKGSHQKTIAAIEKCYANDIPLQVNCPIIDLNKNDYQEVLKWVSAKGMKANADFNIMAQTDFELSNMEHTLSYGNAKHVFKEMVQDDKQMLNDYKEMLTKDTNNLPDKNRHVCGAAFNTLHISSKGKVYPCANWQSFELGDLHNETLKEIYLNGKKTKAVRNIKFSKYMDTIGKDLFPFTKICPSHFANSNQGDFTKIPNDVLENARMKKEAVEEIIRDNKNR
mgnify:CR=1 FL=1